MQVLHVGDLGEPRTRDFEMELLALTPSLPAPRLDSAQLPKIETSSILSSSSLSLPTFQWSPRPWHVF